VLTATSVLLPVIALPMHSRGFLLLNHISLPDLATMKRKINLFIIDLNK